MEPWTTVTLGARIGLAAYQQRQPMLNLWKRIMARLADRSETILITGMPGVGKTVLLQHMTGEAYKAGYITPGTSRKAQTKRIYKSGAVMALTDIPGQTSDPRQTALDEVLRGKKKVDGVVHVVSNGFTALRQEEAGLLLRQESYDTLEKFRNLQRKEEISEFEETAREIRQAARRMGSPRWVIIAVDKVDLFYTDTELLDAYAHYAKPGGEFCDKVEELVNNVGRDKLSVDVVPVCAWPEDFTWGDHQVRSALHTPQRDALIFNLLESIESLSG